jgi:hypothetical protein
MTQNPSASDWAAARGEQWLAQAFGMEAMLLPVDEPLFAALQLEAPLTRLYRRKPSLMLRDGTCARASW